MPFPSPMHERESEVAQSCLTLATPWTAAYQALPSMGFFRQKYWSGVPLHSPNHSLETEISTQCRASGRRRKGKLQGPSYSKEYLGMSGYLEEILDAHHLESLRHYLALKSQ